MNKKLSCPSAPIKKGHFLIGKFEGDSLRFNQMKTEIDQDLFNEIKEDGKSSYRAAMDCVTIKCLNWNGSKCVVTTQINSYFETLNPDKYQNCSIRETCRWFHQDGYSACQMCPLIKTQFIID